MKRRGISLLETAVAGAMLLTLMAVCVRYFAVTARHRLIMNQRQTALQETANVMERLTARPFSQLSAESLSPQALSPDARRLLGDAELKVEITPQGEKPSAKRIMVTIRWQDQNGQWTRPLRLVAWRYQP